MDIELFYSKILTNFYDKKMETHHGESDYNVAELYWFIGCQEGGSEKIRRNCWKLKLR